MTDQPVSQEARDAAWVLGLFHSTEDAVQAFHRFESLIRADQKERDARVADEERASRDVEASDGSVLSTGGMAAALRIATAIRNQEPST